MEQSWCRIMYNGKKWILEKHLETALSYKNSILMWWILKNKILNTVLWRFSGL